jgi:hypothetical protein
MARNILAAARRTGARTRKMKPASRDFHATFTSRLAGQRWRWQNYDLGGLRSMALRGMAVN